MPKAPTPATIEVPKTFVMPDGTEHVVTPIEPTAEDFNVFVADQADHKPNKLKRTLGAILLAGAAVGATIVATNHSDEAPLSAAGAEETTTTGAPSIECADTWTMGELNNEGHRVITTGLPEAGSATNASEAKDAVSKWIAAVSTDKEIFSGVLASTLHDTVAPEALSDGKCATPVANTERGKLEAAVAMAIVAPGEVPASWTNTGVDASGNLVASAHPGISGNRRGVLVSLQDGTKFGVMERCGNPTFPGKPALKEGPTDEVPKKPTPGMQPKTDKNTSPGGVPNQNGGDSTSPGAVAGEGPVVLERPTNSGGYGPGEYTPTTPPQDTTPTDPNSNTTPVENGGTPNTSPTVTVVGIDPNNGNKGTTDPNGV